MKRKRESGWDEVKLTQEDWGMDLHMYQARGIYDAWEYDDKLYVRFSIGADFAPKKEKLELAEFNSIREELGRFGISTPRFGGVKTAYVWEIDGDKGKPVSWFKEPVAEAFGPGTGGPEVSDPGTEGPEMFLGLMGVWLYSTLSRIFCRSS